MFDQLVCQKKDCGNMAMYTDYWNSNQQRKTVCFPVHLITATQNEGLEKDEEK